MASAAPASEVSHSSFLTRDWSRRGEDVGGQQTIRARSSGAHRQAEAFTDRWTYWTGREAMSDYLFLVCELAAAFAGFTAIVSVLDQRSDSGSLKIDVVRLRMMVELSLVVIGAGLLPALLFRLGMEEHALWRIACAAMLVGGVALIRIQSVRGFRKEIRAAPNFNLAFARFLQLLGGASIAAFACGAFKWIPADAAFHLGVTLLLSVAGLQFLRAAVSVMEERARDPSSE